MNRKKTLITKVLNFDEGLTENGDYVICRFSHCAKVFPLNLVIETHNELVKEYPRSKHRHSILCDECGSSIVNDDGKVTRTSVPHRMPTVRTTPSKRGTYYEVINPLIFKHDALHGDTLKYVMKIDNKYKLLNLNTGGSFVASDIDISIRPTNLTEEEYKKKVFDGTFVQPTIAK